jgi:hypothetical protein
MKRAIVEDTETVLGIEDIVAKLSDNQKQRQDLLQKLAAQITKSTEGSFYLSDDNAGVPKYWLTVAQEHSDILPPIFDVEDFEMKATAFETICNMKKSDEKVAAVLKTPRDIISRDCFWYVSYLTKQVKAFDTNPVFKKILQNAPVIREMSKKIVAPTVDTTTSAN